MSATAKADAFGLRIANKVASRLSDRCFIQAAVQSKDSRGGIHVGYADQGLEPIPCRIVAQVGRELKIAGETRSVTAYKLRLAAYFEGLPIVIHEKDRLRVLSHGAFSEKVMQVEFVGEMEGGTITVLSLLVGDSAAPGGGAPIVTEMSGASLLSWIGL